MTPDLSTLLDRARLQASTATLLKLDDICGKAIKKMIRAGLIMEKDRSVASHVLCSTSISELILAYAEQTGETDEQRDDVLRSVLTVLFEHPQIRQAAVNAYSKVFANRAREKVRSWIKA